VSLVKFLICMSKTGPQIVDYTTEKEDSLFAGDYLEKILTARVYDVATESPLDPAPLLSERLGNTLLLKREDMQSVFSFKLRGAYNKMAQLTPQQRRRGVIAASAGNHAQGVALAAHTLGCSAVIVMPVTTPQIEINAVKGFRGVRVVLHGDSYSEAQEHAAQLMA
jgi:threonine dehydratase